MPKPLFHTGHYNIIAAQIRNNFTTAYSTDAYPNRSSWQLQREKALMQRAVAASIAINLAERFLEDNPNFDPLKFLDACSPDTDLYPLSELWED